MQTLTLTLFTALTLQHPIEITHTNVKSLNHFFALAQEIIFIGCIPFGKIFLWLALIGPAMKHYEAVCLVTKKAITGVIP